MSSKRSSSTAPSSSSSAVAIIEGNNDLLFEILLFLPAKSLIRFKVVSKRWRSLISAPLFCREHTLHQPRRCRETQPLLIRQIHRSDQYLVYNPTVSRFFQFSFPFGFFRVRIRQSCNGLLQLTCRKAEEGNIESYHVFNPTTLQQRELSPLPTSSFVGGIYLMFDPSLSSHYRVVCFARNETRTLDLFYVYDSETHKWKLGGECNKSIRSLWHGIYCNGGIYFLRFRSSYRFDPDDNVSEIPSLPRHYSHGISNEHYVVESNGVLHCLSLPIEEGSCCLLNVSEMKQNENRWSNKYQVDMQPILAACGEQARNIHHLSIFRGEKEQDSLLILCFSGKKIVIYRLYDEVFEVQDHASEEFLKDRPVWWDFRRFFIRSLAPV